MNHPVSRIGLSPALSRRQFLLRTATVTAFSFVPAQLLGRAGAASPNNKLNVALIGVGGRGQASFDVLKSENLVALCDVDDSRAAGSMRAVPRARFFQDYRVLLDTVGRELDAVAIATPDHTHAVAAMRAIRMGKHVYCEKPLAHSLYEVRKLTEAAREQKVATQLGNQGHSSDSIREFVEMIQAGAVGTVREVHAWCQNSYRPRQYRVRPTEMPPVPAGLNWDLWLGPAPQRPYHPVYHPGRWRGWVEFGTGIIGDWTCHVLDPVFWALNLGSPASVLAHAEEYDDPKVRAETYPAAAKLAFEFPAKAGRPGVTVRWFTGGATPPRPEELEPNRKLPNIGAVVIGDKGKIMYGSHGAAGAQLIPAAKNEAYQRPPKTIPRVAGHHEDWLAACRGGAPAGSNFNYGGPLTEIALLGVLAMRLNGQKLQWDAAALRVTNNLDANRHLNPPYRKGWLL